MEYRVKFFVGADEQWYRVSASSPDEAVAFAREQIGSPDEPRSIFVTTVVEEE